MKRWRWWMGNGVALIAIANAPGVLAQSVNGGINVTVNGEPVPFPGQTPVERGGAILVPLRGVFEKLGATVQFEGPTKTIRATKGPTTVVLRLGESVAVVNGVERALSSPAEAAGGGTLVPLRFVSEALGAQVKWDKTSRTVVVTTDASVAASLPSPPGTGPVTGTITAILPETNSITLRITGGQNTRVALADGAVVLVRGANGGPGTEAKLTDLREGDQVTVRRDAQGLATVIESAFGERRGEVKSIAKLSSGNFVVTLSDGSVVEVVAGAPVLMAGRNIVLTDITPGETVVIRINPQTKLGIGIAVVTGEDPTPRPPAKVEVSSFTTNAKEPLRAGDVLVVTLRGTPEASGTFSIPGIETAQNLPLKESASEPGLYSGSFTIPAGMSVKGASVLASLTLRGTQSPIIQAGNPLDIDAVGPTLGNLSPLPDVTLPEGRPLIYGTYSDAGSSIDPKSVRLTLNSQDVTAKATVTEAFFSFRPDAELPAGENTVRVSVRDAAGNETARDWKFSVTAAEKLIQTLTFTPEGKTLAADDVLTVRAAGVAGGKAAFSIGGSVMGQPMREETPGVYVGTYKVKKGDSLTKAPITVLFTATDGRTVTQSAGQSVTIAAGAPDAPIVDSPQEGVAVGNSVTISGRAAPNATVRVTVEYRGRLVIIGARGTVTNVETKADAQGRWSVPDVKLSSPPGVSGLTYTLRAVVLDAAGDESDPATVTFKR